MGGNPIQFDYSLLLSLVFPLGFFAIVVYFMLSIIQFLKRKAITDKQLIEKMDELIKLQQQSNKLSKP